MIKTNPKDNSRRKFPGENGPRQDKAARKRAQAQASQEAWRALSPTEQIAELDKRLGKGVGAKKQRARLAKMLKARAA